MNLTDKVSLEMEVGTLTTLIAGLYCLNAVVDPIAIPQSVYIELCEKIVPLLESWDYSKISFEDWIKYNLIIAPKIMFSDDDIEEFKRNTIYFERDCGNVMLICTAEVV